MANDDLQPMPMSPVHSPAEWRNAAMQFSRTRRGRTLIAGAVFVVVILGLVFGGNSESISESYKSFKDNHLPSWRPHTPHLPSIISTPLKPSNRTLDIESGRIEKVPSHMHKSSPNFHLLMPASDDTPEFCKTTLSAMLLNYPPPTILNLFKTFETEEERDFAKLKKIAKYLKKDRLVNDEDLVLVVDGYDTWFQLPAKVLIKQYQNVLGDANKRLMEKYGFSKEDAQQMFSQRIVFGASKTCQGDEMACGYAPESILPENIYGQHTGKSKAVSPARYLNAGTIMGPAKELRDLFEAAVKRVDEGKVNAKDMQSVLSTIFGEQQLARQQSSKKGSSYKSMGSKWSNWLDVQLGRKNVESEKRSKQAELTENQRHEFFIGLDYFNTMFQPTTDIAEDELLLFKHDNNTDVTVYHHPNTPTPHLGIPKALAEAIPPFFIQNLEENNPSPNNNKDTYIKQLAMDDKLDKLPNGKTSWYQVKLAQNTYTAAVPAIIHLNKNEPLVEPSKRSVDIPVDRLRSLLARSADIANKDPYAAAKMNFTFSDLWYAPYSRALLRRYFRLPQSPLGYHSAAVGGDRGWDQRGGRGGVWTAKQALWYAWGEGDGVCGSVDQLKAVFHDGKGVWLHEGQDNAEAERREETKKHRKLIEELRRKDNLYKEMEKQQEEVEKKLERQQYDEGKKGMLDEAGRRVQVHDELDYKKKAKTNE